MGIGNIGKTLGLMGATVAAGGGPEDPVGDAAALFEGGEALATSAGAHAAEGGLADEIASTFSGKHVGAYDLESDIAGAINPRLSTGGKYGYGLAEGSSGGLSTLQKLGRVNNLINDIPKPPNAWSTTEGAAATTRGGLSGTQFRGM